MVTRYIEPFVIIIEIMLFIRKRKNITLTPRGLEHNSTRRERKSLREKVKIKYV